MADGSLPPDATDWRAPATWRDPYPHYARLRGSGPLHWSPQFFGGAWLVTGHDDCEAVLRDPRFSAQRTGGWIGQALARRWGLDGEGAPPDDAAALSAGAGGVDDAARAERLAFQRFFARSLIFLDAPHHGRVRKLMQKAFAPVALRASQAAISAMADEHLDAVDAALQRGETVDWMPTVARAMPARVIAHLLGVPLQPQFVAWSDDIAAFIGAVQPGRRQFMAASRALRQLTAWFEQHLEVRARAGTPPESAGDLVGHLLAHTDWDEDQSARTEGRESGPGDSAPLSRAELIAQCAMLLFAGHETTRNLLGNGLLALLQHPATWRDLADHPEAASGAVRELLRWDSPVQYTGRRLVSDLHWHGQTLRRGDLVIALIGSANRDPARYAHPDQLDIRRDAGLHLSFGQGPHLCIGLGLSHIEAETVFARAARRWPTLQIASSAFDTANAVYRGLEHLQIRLG
ncbi:cytochrome P450 [Amphibiibacter pelophylacis]|uniref:Cytochrome P450 n=1 Tax=Amphibiibacter pelophylacis TaxID=1799477 RepID=A0ACC6P2P7_9BURK